MCSFTEFSTLFSTKVNFILELHNFRKKRRLKDLALLINENYSTVTNWFSDKKLPKPTKRLFIADQLGVSYNYLFNNNINVINIEKPEAYFHDGYYSIPFINEEDVFSTNKLLVYPIRKRVKLMIDNLTDFIYKYGQRIYATQAQNSKFSPYINEYSNIIYFNGKLISGLNLVLYQSSSCRNSIEIKELTSKYNLNNHKSNFAQAISSKGLLPNLINNEIGSNVKAFSIITSYINFKSFL